MGVWKTTVAREVVLIGFKSCPKITVVVCHSQDVCVCVRDSVSQAHAKSEF